MGIIYQHDKRSGITYAYESKAYWDKEKRQSRAKRTLIGRVDAKTGEIVPTDGRVRKAKERAAEPDYKVLYTELLDNYAALEAELAISRDKLKGSKEK
jgi:hypothetical protein